MSDRPSNRLTRAERRAAKRRNQRIILGFIILIVLALIAFIAYSGLSGKNDITTTPTGLKYQELQAGTGAVAKAGDLVSVHYTGRLMDGTQFDSSIERGQPFQFVLGKGDVIKGWDEGVAGMKAGGKRRLIIPPELGYGPDDYGPIPGNSTLTFEVELLEVSSPQ